MCERAAPNRASALTASRASAFSKCAIASLCSLSAWRACALCVAELQAQPPAQRIGLPVGPALGARLVEQRPVLDEMPRAQQSLGLEIDGCDREPGDAPEVLEIGERVLRLALLQAAATEVLERVAVFGVLPARLDEHRRGLGIGPLAVELVTGLEQILARRRGRALHVVMTHGGDAVIAMALGRSREHGACLAHPHQVLRGPVRPGGAADAGALAQTAPGFLPAQR